MRKSFKSKGLAVDGRREPANIEIEAPTALIVNRIKSPYDISLIK